MSKLEPNVRCKRGHKFYSPDPDAWVGRTCGRTNAHVRGETTANARGCQAVLTRVGQRNNPHERIPF